MQEGQKNASRENYKAATEAFYTILQKDATFIEAENRLSTVYFLLGMFSEAERGLRKVPFYFMVEGLGSQQEASRTPLCSSLHP
jgi:thioredoxin-like negative regulator of GroEL